MPENIVTKLKQLDWAILEPKQTRCYNPITKIIVKPDLISG